MGLFGSVRSTVNVCGVQAPPASQTFTVTLVAFAGMVRSAGGLIPTCTGALTLAPLLALRTSSVMLITALGSPPAIGPAGAGPTSTRSAVPPAGTITVTSLLPGSAELTMPTEPAPPVGISAETTPGEAGGRLVVARMVVPGGAVITAAWPGGAPPGG